MSALRDFQRGRLYKAEAELPHALRGQYFECVEDMQAYAMEVTADPGVRRAYPHWPDLKDLILVEPGRVNQRRCFCWADEHRITMAPGNWWELWLLHELAHALHPSGVKHRPEFAFTYTLLVARFLGRPTHRALCASFRRHKVLCSP